jgi:brefeldin A-resistance guanine nucleotide exchange factor 1
MHLKYQFEALMIRLMDIITTGNAPFEFREIASEYLVAFFRHLTHLPHEIYFNYDCDPYASNLLEDLLQLFSKNCFVTSLNNQQISSTPNVTFTSMQMLSLDALLANLKSLQKAELCHDDVLVVCPATSVVNLTSSKPVIEKNSETSIQATSDVSPSLPTATQEPDKDSDQSVDVLPQDVDVGFIRGEQMDSSFTEFSLPVNESIELSETTISQNEVKEISDNETVRTDQTRHKFYVSYKFPKLDKVPKNTIEITQQKQRKVMLSTATELFNTKPTKGIQFLTENKLISNEMDIVSFLRDNPKLDKKQIGEYLSNKKNLKVLQTFVESFAFKDIRLDEALRLYLESFRLPGEAPLISMVLEQFAHHWHVSQTLFSN